MASSDLAFGWDDGVFISPFVASGPETIQELVTVLRAPPFSVGTAGAAGGGTAEDILLDLGSGDGCVLVAACTALGCRGVGLELDPALVDTARAMAASSVAPGAAPRVRFDVQDISDPCVVASFGGRVRAVYTYLLPEALVALQGTVEALFLSRPTTGEATAVEAPVGFVRCRGLVSHRWDVPYLAPFEAGRTGALVAYAAPPSPTTGTAEA